MMPPRPGWEHGALEESSAEDRLIETSVEDPEENEQPGRSSGSFASIEYADIVRYFTLMGWAAFGGPQAHIGMFETV
jgi:hypothetical protein